jgi:cation diffusion facilitator CzcD-associated flavoprotein CzcO
MPEGMLLRSSRRSSGIATPDPALSFESYQRGEGEPLPEPIPLKSFVRYARWFQQNGVPDVDERRVVRVETTGSGFRVSLEDGESISVGRVVVAAGLSAFARRPPPFDTLPRELRPHACEQHEVASLRGDRVIVIGAGQSAIEYAALLHEAGVEVEVIVRAPRVRWMAEGSSAERLGDTWLGRVAYPATDVGPPVLSQIIRKPDLFRHLPLPMRYAIERIVVRPAAASWLRARVAEVPITTGRTAVSAAQRGDRVSIDLDDGTRREADRLLLATGYCIDLSRYSFLVPEILRSLRLVRNAPALLPGFESSVPGLHFLGSAAAPTFGPLMYFLGGTSFAARSVTRKIAGRVGVAAPVPA